MAERRRESAWVYLDAAELGPRALVGVLSHERVRGRTALSFEYDRDWLRNGAAFTLDPALELYEGEQYPARGQFGIFLDSAPDRWGRTLMERREVLVAEREERAVRALGDWEFLLGVHDHARLGALRFRRGPDGPFVDKSELSAPPVARLQELEESARRIEEPGSEERPAYAQWLSLLTAPGSSLGGARPKASFIDRDGALWLAKFPSREDRRDVGAWEFLLHQLARAAGIDVGPARLVSLSPRYRTFCSRRFDRVAGGRRMFASAMTLLDRRDGDEGGSYLDLAQLVQDQGARGAIGRDLDQLFRRLVFNLMVGNRDDHLRNHGFLRLKGGWRPSPAFDMNPTADTDEHVLAIDERQTRPDLDTALATAELYRLSRAKAEKIAAEIRSVVATWDGRARGLDLPKGEITRMAPAFHLAKAD
jgi:serine/threonine-protein kinase HipA